MDTNMATTIPCLNCFGEKDSAKLFCSPCSARNCLYCTNSSCPCCKNACEQIHRKKNLTPQDGLNMGLSHAVQMNNPDKVKRLLELGADPNYHNGTQWPVLFVAASYRYLDIVKILLEAGASLIYNRGKTFVGHGKKIKEVDDLTSIIMYLISNSNITDDMIIIKLMHFFLKRDINIIGCEDKFGDNVLAYALKYGTYSIVQYLLKYMGISANGMIHNVSTSLYDYILWPEMRCRGDFDGVSYLTHAVLHGSFHVVKLLIDYGANISELSNGKTACQYLILDRRLDLKKNIFELLFGKHATHDLQEQHKLLQMATMTKNQEAIELLQKIGVHNGSVELEDPNITKFAVQFNNILGIS